MGRTPLLGRERETQAIAQLFARTHPGGHARTHPGGHALNVRGDAGIGKSTLLATARSQARERGWVVLSAQATPSETPLAFAGLHQLLHPLLDRFDHLPDPQRDAICAAFGLADRASPDPFFVALATLGLLSDAAGDAPILTLVEDAQWLDRPTCEVLTFVARRLETDPIVMLNAIRSGIPSPLTSAGIPELVIDGLDPASAATLLDEHADGLSPAIRARLLNEARGNPLALIELPAAVRRAHLDHFTTRPSWLPLTERLQQVFTRQLDDLPVTTRQVLLLAALDADGAIGNIVAATEAMRGTAGLDDFTPAVSAGIIELDETSVRFRHPLIRSAVYHASTSIERHTAHAALATVPSAQPEHALWHEAAGALGTDEGLATQLAATASRAQRRGDINGAIAALERSADLTADSSVRTRHLLRAAELVYDLGRPDEVQRLLGLVDTPVTDVGDRARAAWLHEMLIPQSLTAATRSTLIDTADRAREAGDLDSAIRVLWVLAMRCWWDTVDDDGWAPVRAAIDRVSDHPLSPPLLAVHAYATPFTRASDTAGTIAVAPLSDDDVDALWMLGNAASVVGELGLASQLLSRAGSALRARGRLGHLARVLTLAAWADAHIGHWEPARLGAEEAGRLADETGQPIWQAGAHVTSAIVAARRGETDLAESLATLAERQALPTDARFLLAAVQFARGITTLAAGNHADAYNQLRRLFDPSERAYHPPTTFAAVADLTEAALHSRNLDDAAAIVAAHPMLHAPTTSQWIRITMTCTRPLLTSDPDAESAYLAALDGEVDSWPFQHARLQLAYGQWLRRRRRTADSRGPLRAARDTFDTLGAAPWSQQARRELRASGEASTPHPPRARDRLTAQELQIAELAAAGMSNREIAQQLFLSHRTVGTHLYRMFPKLGITSRGQLHHALGDTPHTNM